ncbi:hypothetical protein yrohd0001_16380 [Yersinia rohdei ATCC 43380]|nr:hypothetical protein yrohd0001_16380 [Yersinia rohdei ATCC 43380]
MAEFIRLIFELRAKIPWAEVKIYLSLNKFALKLAPAKTGAGEMSVILTPQSPTVAVTTRLLP